MFDGSNLRCAIRTYKLVNKLKVRDNFSKVTESRRDHLAIVVEEEYQQSMFNGYCLYANGYRVIPIMTATELKWINKDENEKYIKEGVDNNTPKATSRLAKYMPVKWCRDKVMEWRRKTDPKTIVVRDYDLQFIDERKCLTVEKPEVINESGEKVEEINEIDLVRGAKYCADITVKKTEGGKEIIDRKYTDDFVLVPKDTKSNPYWKAFENTPTFFVSKGGSKLITKKCIKKK